jgi:hypothetical protein
MPPRTACGSAFVRRTARFGPGWRLAFVVEGDTRQLEALVARKGHAGSNPAERTRCPLDRRPPAPCKGRPPRSALGKGSQWPVALPTGAAGP